MGERITATGFTTGNSLYHQRARKALPILAGLARGHETISYTELAGRLGMPNPRNLNLVLGSIGVELKQLSRSWSQPIPPIECLVVKSGSGVSGPGVRRFLPDGDQSRFEHGPVQQKRAIQNRILQQVHAFPDWPEVLRRLGVEPPPRSVLLPVSAASASAPENDAHLRLKLFVASHPACLGLPHRLPTGEAEHLFPSGDRIDVLFRRENEWIGVAVKTALASEDDLQRSLFQCVKYRALMKAERLCRGENPDHVRVFLLLEAALPESLREQQERLKIAVVENVQAATATAAAAG